MFSLRNRFKKSTSQQPYNLHIRVKKTYLNDYISPEFYNDLNYNSLSSQTGY